MSIKAALGLLEKNFEITGEARFQGKDLLGMDHERLRRLRGREVTMVLQNPMNCFDPLYRVGEQMAETFAEHTTWSGREIRTRSLELLRLMKIRNPEEVLRQYPHQMSGGMRQRVMIAMALACNPRIIIADEPISALDMSIRAQVLNLLRRLQKERGITYLFIAHDLSVMRYISDRIAVIHKGSIVELADAEELVAHAIHPYTRSLLSAIPMPDPRRERNKKLLVYDPAMHDYSTEAPQWRELRPRHWVLCSAAEAAQWLPQA